MVIHGRIQRVSTTVLTSRWSTMRPEGHVCMVTQACMHDCMSAWSRSHCLIRIFVAAWSSHGRIVWCLWLNSHVNEFVQLRCPHAYSQLQIGRHVGTLRGLPCSLGGIMESTHQYTPRTVHAHSCYGAATHSGCMQCMLVARCLPGFESCIQTFVMI